MSNTKWGDHRKEMVLIATNTAAEFRLVPESDYQEAVKAINALNVTDNEIRELSYNKALYVKDFSEKVQQMFRLAYQLGAVDIRDRLSTSTECPHPFASVIGDEHGNPKCLKCNKELR